MNAAYALTGTIQSPRTVLLDEPLPVSSGRVIVMVQPAETEQRPRPHYLETVERIAADLEASGHVPLSANEIAAWVDGERNGWE